MSWEAGRGKDRGRIGGREAPGEEVDEQQQWLSQMRLKKSILKRKAERSGGAATGGVKIPRSGGTALGGDTKTRMEGQLGADLSGVKLHTGGESAEAARALGARAFTDGTDVHFGAGQFAPGSKEGDRLLAHELTHVVQAQRSGIQRKAEEEGEAEAEGVEAAGPEVSDPDEPAEKEADAVADEAAANLHGDGAADGAEAGQEAAPRKKIAAKLTGVGRKIFRSGAEATPIGDVSNRYHVGPGAAPTAPAAVNAGAESMAENPNFEADAIEFEKNLGGLAFSRASGVGDTLVGKVKTYLAEKLPKGEFDKLGDDAQKLIEKCGKASQTFAGAVGTDPQVLQEVLMSEAEAKAVRQQWEDAKTAKESLENLQEPPNIREQMTLVYNFTTNILVNDLLNTPKDKLAEFSAKMQLNGDAVEKRYAFMEKQAALRQQGGQAKGGDGRSSWDFVGMVPTDHAGSEVNQGEGGAEANTTQAVEGQWSARENRNKAENQLGMSPSSDISSRTAGDVSGEGAELSGREKQNMGITSDQDKLKWSEGAKMWIINEKDKWVQTMRKLSMPLAAGPSGTTNVLMNANALLGAVDPAQARLACIGYLLPIRAHSLVEVCAAASAYGVGFSPGKTMYRNLPPLQEPELRECGRPGGEGKKLFPDEADPPPAGAETQAAPGATGGGPGGG